MPFHWPDGFARVPDHDWVRAPIGDLARKYDTVESHGWYRNLDRTVADLRGVLRDGDLLLDYSGGTGILASCLLEEAPNADFGILIVDSSPKFLRLALEKFRDERRVAFRLIRYLREERRLELLQEVLDPGIQQRGVDAVSSTNAIHLYYALEDTLRSWVRVLRPEGFVFVQSGNIGLEQMPTGGWIIDETVEAIHRAACELVREGGARSPYRAALEDEARMAAYESLRRKFFLPVRPLSFYSHALEGAGLKIEEVAHERIEAEVAQWYEFLSAYHEGVLGWVGGSRRVEGAEPAQEAIADRLDLLRRAMERVFGGRETFDAVWTYIRARRPAGPRHPESS